MNKFKTILKRLFFPITFLTLLTIASVIIAMNAVVNWLQYGGESAIYPAITLPIMVFFIALYVCDRWLVNKITYVKIMIGEGLIFVGVLFLFLFYNKTVDVQFETNSDYVVVLFDAKENTLSLFSDKGIFGKELIVKDKPILHLDAAMNLRHDLRVLSPKSWSGSIHNHGVYKPESDSVPYIFIMKHKLDTGNWKRNQTFIDSIIQNERLR